MTTGESRVDGYRVAPEEEAMKQGSTRRRSRLAGGLAGASALVVLLLLPLSSPALADSTNYAGRGALNTAASASSVVGMWHLDERSGTTAFDSSGNGNNGAISGPVTLGVPGHLNTAYSFVPKGSVIVPNASDLVPGTAKITISYWLKTTTLPCCNGLQAGPNVVDGQWHQVTCVRNGTQIVETVDRKSFSVTKATGAITVTDPIRLGSHKGGGDWYKGVLDEVTYSIGS
jgi:hypothetical protein